MSIINSGTHYLLLITMLNTKSPPLTRVLTVPSTTTFQTLHHAISASFGLKSPLAYGTNTNMITPTISTWSYDVVIGDPVRNPKPTELKTILHISLNPSSSTSSGGTTTTSSSTSSSWDASTLKMESVFDHFKCRGKDLLYTNPAVPVEYNNNKLLGIKVLGRAAKVTKEEGIMCVGGLGRLDGVWNGDLDVEEVFGELREWGNWDPDFGKVQGRLGSVQKQQLQPQGQMAGGMVGVRVGASSAGHKGKGRQPGGWYVVHDDEDCDLDI